MKFSVTIISYIEKMKHQSLWDSHDLCEVLSAANLSQTPSFYNELLISSVHAGEIKCLARALSGQWPKFYPNEIREWARTRKFKLPLQLQKRTNTDMPVKNVSQSVAAKEMHTDLVCLDKFDSNMVNSVLDLGIQSKILIYTMATQENKFFKVTPTHLQHVKSNLPAPSVICFNPQGNVLYPSPTVAKNYIASGVAQTISVSVLWVCALEVEKVANIYTTTKNIELENIELRKNIQEVTQKIQDLETEKTAYSALFEENEYLKKQLDLANPSIGEDNPYYAPELHMATIIWKKLVDEETPLADFRNKATALLASRFKITSGAQKDRIATLVNPGSEKKGGRK